MSCTQAGPCAQGKFSTTVLVFCSSVCPGNSAPQSWNPAVLCAQEIQHHSPGALLPCSSVSMRIQHHSPGALHFFTSPLSNIWAAVTFQTRVWQRGEMCQGWAQGTRQDNVLNSHIKEKKSWCLLVPQGWSPQTSLSDEVPALVQCE